MINFSKLKQSFVYAFRGLRHAFVYHQNLRIHSVLACLAIVFGVLLRISFCEWVAVLLMIFLVLAAEMINTAFEEMTNLLKCEHDRRCEIAKDVSAGMVLLAAIFAVIVAAVVFLPKIIQLL